MTIPDQVAHFYVCWRICELRSGILSRLNFFSRIICRLPCFSDKRRFVNLNAHDSRSGRMFWCIFNAYANNAATCALQQQGSLNPDIGGFTRFDDFMRLVDPIKYYNCVVLGTCDAISLYLLIFYKPSTHINQEIPTQNWKTICSTTKLKSWFYIHTCMKLYWSRAAGQKVTHVSLWVLL